MKKILLFLSAVLLALLAPAYARAAVTPVPQSAPVMVTLFGGNGFSMGIIHQEQVDELHKATESFVTYSGCRLDPDFRTKADNYIADHPMMGTPSADWLVGIGKAVGADYVNYMNSNLDSFHTPGFFHTTVEGMITTTLRTIRVSDGVTVLTANASQEGKIEKTSLQCALVTFENAKQVEKDNHIIFVKK
mgnify:FL=1|jgi:hypothetical protein|nr:MAG TPA: hypothetical protein [Caudoviricetes sp.]